jgi:nitrous oxidase accessory protein
MRNILLILIILSWLPALSRNLVVGRGQNFVSIKSALAAANDGDTITVLKGVYREQNIEVAKVIFLQGKNFPVIDAEGKYEGLTISANDIVVEGFKIINTGSTSTEDYAGIKLNGVSKAIIRNNILDNTVWGIYALQANNCLIENNRITSYGKVEQQSGNGIHCWKSDSMRIINNNVTGHRDGIYFEFVTNSMIWRNNSHGNIRYGLHFMFSNNDSYISNIFEGNGAGVAVMYSHGVKMFHNFFEENWGDAAYGLLLKEISDSYIDGNYFNRNTSGIYMEGASRIHLTKNTFSNNGWAMKIQANCMDIQVESNNFLNNTFDVGTNGSLVLNRFDRNYWDKYEGYDINKDKIGDVPFRPVSMYSMIVEKNPPAMILFRSFIAALLDKTEKVLPSLTPENLKDDHPLMKPLSL